MNNINNFGGLAMLVNGDVNVAGDLGVFGKTMRGSEKKPEADSAQDAPRSDQAQSKQAPVVAVNQGRIWGDPHFVGADGGKFDVQGEAGKTYNLLSDKNLQVNSTFVAGAPGTTYMGQVGITMGQDKVEIGPKGALSINGQSDLADGSYLGGRVFKDGNNISVKSNEYDMKFQTADKVVNSMDIRSANANADGVMPQGLWGGTVDGDGMARNGDAGKGMQGGGGINGRDGQVTQKGDQTSVKDYEVGGLFDTQFGHHNKFNGDAKTPGAGAQAAAGPQAGAQQPVGGAQQPAATQGTQKSDMMNSAAGGAMMQMLQSIQQLLSEILAMLSQMMQQMQGAQQDGSGQKAEGNAAQGQAEAGAANAETAENATAQAETAGAQQATDAATPQGQTAEQTALQGLMEKLDGLTTQLSSMMQMMGMDGQSQAQPQAQTASASTQARGDMQQMLQGILRQLEALQAQLRQMMGAQPSQQQVADAQSSVDQAAQGITALFNIQNATINL